MILFALEVGYIHENCDICIRKSSLKIQNKLFLIKN